MSNVKIVSCGKRVISKLNVSITNPLKENSFCIVFMPLGKAVVSFNEYTYKIKSGDFIIATPQDIFSFTMSKKAKTTIYYAQFIPEESENFLDKYKLESGVFHCRSEKDVRTAFAFFLNEFMIKSEFYHLRINALFTQLMCTLSASRFTPDCSFDQIRKLASDINREFRLPSIDITSYADELNISKDRFSVIFKKQFGYPPHQYHIMLKIREAEFLLESSNLSIGEISDYLGFSNQLYFSTVYKKHTGLTPSQARKKRKTFTQIPIRQEKTPPKA